jgi:hypothetical protein
MSIRNLCRLRLLGLTGSSLLWGTLLITNVPSGHQLLIQWPKTTFYNYETAQALAFLCPFHHN